MRKRRISEDLRRRTHSSSIESPLVEVGRRFHVLDVSSWYVRSYPLVVLVFL